MKTNIILLIFILTLLGQVAFAQQNVAAPRITFMLKNTLGYHRMFRVEGPGIAYGFTMSKRETVPCTWPVGSRLYFSRDGETTSGLILTIIAADEGKTLGTDTGASESKAEQPIAEATVRKAGITLRLRNSGVLPRKVALISYEPGESGNSTSIFTMAPLVGIKTVRYPVGTKLYIADDEQVDVVMSGKRIDNSKPFMTVQASDAGKTFNLP